MKQKMLLLAVTGLMVAAVGSSWGVSGTGLPYADGFESGTSGNDLPNPWSFTDVGRYDSSVTTVDGSTNVAYFTDEGAFNYDNVTYADRTNVWVKYYAKVTTASSDPSIDNGTVAGFYITSSGDLKAYSNTAWKTIATGLTTSGWIGFSVHLDYTHKTWDIYKTPDGYSYGDALEKVNTDGPLAFNSSATNTHFGQAVISGTTYIDLFASNVETQEPVDSSTPTKAANAAQSIILGENLTGVLTKYFTAADSTLDGPLGEALANALADGDEIYVYLPSQNPAWQVYLAHGPGVALSQSTGSAGLGITITPTTAIFVQYGSGTTRQPARVTAFDTPQQPGSSVTVYGTDSNGAGWNAFNLPMGASANGGFSNGAMHDMGTFAPVAGDQIWIQKTNGGFELPITYDGSTWRQGRRGANVTITPGQSFWYYRNATGTATWNASGITVE